MYSQPRTLPAIQRPEPPECVHINARYEGTCQTSGQHFAKGRPIAYYRKTKSAHILMSVPVEHDPYNSSPKSPIFKFVEGAFDRWFAGCQPADKKRYELGELSKEGAILEALSNAEDLAAEEGNRVYLHECDLTSSFFC